MWIVRSGRTGPKPRNSPSSPQKSVLIAIGKAGTPAAAASFTPKELKSSGWNTGLRVLCGKTTSETPRLRRSPPARSTSSRSSRGFLRFTTTGSRERMMGPKAPLATRPSLTTKVTGSSGTISTGRIWVSRVLMWLAMNTKGPDPALRRRLSIPVMSKRPRLRSTVRRTASELSA